MQETVRFIVLTDEDADHEKEMREFQEEMRRFAGEVTDWEEFDGWGIATVVFPDYDHALDAANTWQPNDRLEEAGGDMVQLSKEPLDLMEAAENFQAQVQEAAKDAGFIPPLDSEKN